MSAERNIQVVWLERFIKVLVPLLLVIWLAWLLANTVWLLWQGPEEQSVGDLPVISASNSGNQGSSLSEAQVARWELFGPLVVEVAPKAEPENAPETRLRLELLGVFQHADPKVASAIIAEQGKDGKLFKPGDKVSGNVTLEEVYSDRVILNRLGQRESLLLKAAALGQGIQEVSPSSGERSINRFQPPQTDSTSARAGQQLSSDRQEVIRKLALTLSPGGGYAIGAGAPMAQLETLGIRKGDVILSVNGHTLGTETADLAALAEYKASGMASIVVQRGQQRFTINYPP